MPPPSPAASLSAYTGTSCMSINGDLPGLSNFWPGTMGSCQYRGFLVLASAGAARLPPAAPTW